MVRGRKKGKLIKKKGSGVFSSGNFQTIASIDGIWENFLKRRKSSGL